jgi:hypothetical protein
VKRLVILLFAALVLAGCAEGFFLDAADYDYAEIYEKDGVAVPLMNDSDYTTQPTLPTGDWQYKGLTGKQEILFRSFAYSAPEGFTRMYSLIDDQTRVQFSDKACEKTFDDHDHKDTVYSCASDNGGGNWQKGHYDLELHTDMVRHSADGRATVLHEIAHLIDFYYFYGQGYGALQEVIESSPKYKECYKNPDWSKGDPASEKCVHPSEIFAEQLTYYATGYDYDYDPTPFAYDVPRLVSDREIERALGRVYRKEQAIRRGG